LPTEYFTAKSYDHFATGPNSGQTPETPNSGQTPETPNSGQTIKEYY
jgi:hypothetical protein